MLTMASVAPRRRNHPNASPTSHRPSPARCRLGIDGEPLDVAGSSGSPADGVADDLPILDDPEACVGGGVDRFAEPVVVEAPGLLEGECVEPQDVVAVGPSSATHRGPLVGAAREGVGGTGDRPEIVAQDHEALPLLETSGGEGGGLLRAEGGGDDPPKALRRESRHQEAHAS